MKVEIFTGVAPNFERLATVEFNCCHCGMKLRMPAQHLLDNIADKVEEYYREQNKHLIAENKRLTEILETGGYIHLIKRVAERL